MRIASNLLRDRWRHGKVHRRWLEPQLCEAREALPTTTDPDLGLDMERHLRELRPRDRALLWLAYVEGYSHREIADILGLGEASIRVLLSRARGRLADQLRREDLEPVADRPVASPVRSRGHAS